VAVPREVTEGGAAEAFAAGTAVGDEPRRDAGGDGGVELVEPPREVVRRLGPQQGTGGVRGREAHLVVRILEPLADALEPVGRAAAGPAERADVALADGVEDEEERSREAEGDRARLRRDEEDGEPPEEEARGTEELLERDPGPLSLAPRERAEHALELALVGR